MKIRVLAAVFVFAVLFSGCKKAAQSHNTVLTSISFRANISYYNENYTADCVIDKDGNLSAVVTEPENLAGLKFSFIDEKCEVNFGDMSVSDESVYMPENSAVGTINKVFKECQNVTPKKSKHNFKLKGSCDGKKYTLDVSPAGLPISLDIPDLGLKVDFNNVSLVNSKVED